MLVQFARRNLGVASVVEDFAMPSLTGGELFRLVFDCPIPERFMYLMLDKKKSPVRSSQAADIGYPGVNHNHYLR